MDSPKYEIQKSSEEENAEIFVLLISNFMKFLMQIEIYGMTESPVYYSVSLFGEVS